MRLRKIGFLFELNQRIHGFSFLSPRWILVLWFAGPEETKNQAGKSPPPDSIRLATPSVKKSRQTVKTNSPQARIADPFNSTQQ